ncbi:ATP-dependent ABC transporter [Scheffersomyces stipitis CBS 6054]|uniref:ATP-dependent ABC transporter n=1 Tax=Scheffersomyces stipitis (strain ATCC 58785 / CBS 6054 / NBRC 10063 / NRRL Y-11545) TaxID=322104 RepID=A3LR58_PICST|nr:ATP-dependent ABC transporter [Scheffersomyces stipitis CBS 6054]ABN65679.2 ATP-dependent ABC transporter [Scheffersomyces stipitis CBS 6054]
MLDSSILRIAPQDRVAISARGLTISVKSQTKDRSDLESGTSADKATKILDDVSFDLESGQIMAIMGGSGSGKTTLLNTLSQRLSIHNKKLKFEGSVLYSRENTASNIKHAYMQQTDIFLPGLSVYETLKTQADLRLPPSVSEFEKIQYIESLIDVLELQLIRDSRVAAFSSHATSLSGGEQRRVSLAIQLLSKPSVLFLDEPTTGLDTTSSLKLVHTLKKLASPEFGITIVISIHQPRPEITALFDKLCLLTRGGRVVYFGNLLDAGTYFKTLGISDVDHKNDTTFIDYIMDLSVKDTSSREAEEQAILRINNLVQQWKACRKHELIPLETSESGQFEANLKMFRRRKEDKISFMRELVVLTKRSFVLSYRDVLSVLAMNVGSALLAVATGWMFFKPKADLAGIRSITSVLYVMLEVVAFCPMFFEIERLWTTDGVFFYREYSENYVSITGFILSRRFAKFFLEDLPVSLIFAVISNFMWGLRMSTEQGGPTDSSYFGIYFAITLLVELISMSASMFCFAVSPDYSISSLVVNVFYQLQNSACGYFVNARTMPVYVRWVKYIAYFWYGFGALLANQFSGWMGDCPYDNDDPRCEQYSGDYQLKNLGYPIDWIAEPIGILVVWFVGFNLMTFFVFYFKSFDVSIAKTKKNKIGGEDGPHDQAITKEKCSDDDDDAIAQDNEDLEVNVQNVTLNVQKKSLLRKVVFEKTLLDNVSASFAASEVNVIMGPSGSGKTTLLNYLSNRLPKSTSYASNGQLQLNNFIDITPEQLAKASAYVTQHDNSLIHNLTVRETLYYQAKVRLPVEEHVHIPHIINSLIRTTGLIDCAETLIGSEFVKGISGGEKRRVSIAIQLLSRPKILFLDEPTSGLDSSTSVTIMNLLHKLAEENKTTVILTIHQPCEEMFRKFGSLLLLARGGKVVYNGTSGGIEKYLASMNYKVPDDMNIADYILDLVSKNFNEEKEISQARIDDLINQWKLKGGSDTRVTSHNIVDIRNYYHKRLPMYVTFPAIASRQVLTSYRAKDVVISRAGQTIFLTIVHTLFFAPLRNTQDGISNRLGLIQEVLNLYFVGLVNNITLYPFERNLFYQEYKDGTYGVFEFSISYLLNELPTEIVPCLFFSALIVFVCGLPRTAGMFFSMFATGFISINVGESLGIMVNSCFNHMGVAVNILTNFVILAIFMGGTMSLHMPPFFKGINYISPMKYAVGICAKLGFTDQLFECNVEQCSLNTGADVLSYYNLDNDLGAMFAGLIACVVIYRLVAVASIYIRVKYYN